MSQPFAAIQSLGDTLACMCSRHPIRKRRHKSAVRFFRPACRKQWLHQIWTVSASGRPVPSRPPPNAGSPLGLSGIPVPLPRCFQRPGRPLQEAGACARTQEPWKTAADILFAKAPLKQATDNREHRCFSAPPPGLFATRQTLLAVCPGQAQPEREPLAGAHIWDICADVSLLVERPIRSCRYKKPAWLPSTPGTVSAHASELEPCSTTSTTKETQAW